MMTQAEVDALPEAQRAAMHRLQERSGYDWDQFLAMCIPPTQVTPYVGVTGFHGMFVGIEPDGYTHS